MEHFYVGWDSVARNTATTYGTQSSNHYISAVNSSIEQLKNDMDKFANSNQVAERLGGFAAEYWHADTFNIYAALRNSKVRANTLDGSYRNILGGADVTLTSGEEFSLKYMASASESIKEQAKTLFERYKKYCSEHGDSLSFDEYCNIKNKVNSSVNTMLYPDQFRLIPHDQLEEAIKLLKRKIAKEQSTRPDQVVRYQEVLNLLTDRLKSPDGTESVPLSKADATKLAEIAIKCKDKELDKFLESHGLTLDQLITGEYILKQALSAGINAAVISMAIRLAPEIIKMIESLIRDGEIDINAFKRIGGSALYSSGEGFLTGSISAAFTTACLSGKLGESLKSASPQIIGALTVLTINSIKYSISFAVGKKSRGELVENIMRDATITAFSLAMSLGLQAINPELPVFAYTLGSFIGSIIGGIAYNVGHSLFLSFCVEKGFTLFGLVEQDYSLPEDFACEIGFNVFEYEKFKYNPFKYASFKYASFNYKDFKYAPISIRFLRRGVIEVNRIGYI